MVIRCLERCVLAAALAAFCGIATAQSSSHRPDSAFRDSFDGASGPSFDADAARFLAQATFGPTSDGIAHLRDKSLPERARSVIAIAHPDHREALSAAAREARLI